MLYTYDNELVFYGFFARSQEAFGKTMELQ